MCGWAGIRWAADEVICLHLKTIYATIFVWQPLREINRHSVSEFQSSMWRMSEFHSVAGQFAEMKVHFPFVERQKRQYSRIEGTSESHSQKFRQKLSPMTTLTTYRWIGAACRSGIPVTLVIYLASWNPIRKRKQNGLFFFLEIVIEFNISFAPKREKKRQKSHLAR